MTTETQKTSVEQFAIALYEGGYLQGNGDEIQKLLEQHLEMEKERNKINENTSDGYHTFKDLYAIRKAYNVALFNEWALQQQINWSNGVVTPKYNVHKSKKHHDGEYPFGKDNWFIVSALLPSGQISNHYPMEDWDLFKIPETEKALFEFDGHITQDVIERLLKLELQKENKSRYNQLYGRSTED